MTITVSSQAVTAGALGTFSLAMGLGGVDGKYRSSVMLAKLDETFFDVTTLMPAVGGSVTALNSGALTNPTSVLTRSAAATVSPNLAVSTTVSPYFTWTGNPLVNGQGVFLTGTAPGGFTVGTTMWVRDVAGNTFNLAATLGGAAIVPTSTGTAVVANVEYKPNDLIASATSSPTVPFFTIPNSAGGVIIPRIRLSTLGTQNVISWQGVALSVNFWNGGAANNAPPTYTGGDAQLYLPATGAATWLGNFLVTMNQFGDGAVGVGSVTGGNEMAIRLAAGTSVFWDLQCMAFTQPFASQVFTLTAECLN
jgi:hypothetical protein